MKKLTFLSLTASITIFTTGCFDDKETRPSISKSTDKLALKAIESGLKAIPNNSADIHELINNPLNPVTAEKVELGKKLFFETRISKSNLISCNTCHNLALGGDDDISSATGHKWASNPHHLNSPTVYNAVFAEKQFWDGRDPDLEKQAQGPILASPEMASTKEIVLDTIKSMPEYVAEFKTVYGDGEITYEKATAAIGAFERTLVTPSRFDEFLLGNSKALNNVEKKGLETFIDKGCVTCHSGYALGGTMQPFPLFGEFKYANIGDFKGDKNGMVKTPTLRNIMETAPYFHNGSTWNLEESIKIMGKNQLNIELKDEEVSNIISFFKSLTGKKPVTTYPVLPASTDLTPKPNMN